MGDIGLTVDSILSKTKNYAPGAFNEQNTCAVLIEPLLGALGWDTADLAVVDRQFKVYDGTRLAYALKVDGKPALFVEAKGLEQSLDDTKYIAQTVNYANNDGVIWCVLTNGVLYRIYKTNEPVGMAEKLMLEIDLRETVAEPNRSVTLESLAYLSRASLEQGTEPH